MKDPGYDKSYNSYRFRKKVEELPKDVMLGAPPVATHENRLVTERHRGLIYVGPEPPPQQSYCWIDTSEDPPALKWAVGRERVPDHPEVVWRTHNNIYESAPIRFYNTYITDSGEVVEDIYLKLAGRDGGQEAHGGTDVEEHLIFHGTAASIKTGSYILLQPTDGNVGIGFLDPIRKLDIMDDTDAQLRLRAALGVGATFPASFPINFAADDAYVDIQADTNGYLIFDPSGAITVVDGQIKIIGGSPGSGKVLMSDGNGLATWESGPMPGLHGWTHEDGGVDEINVTGLSGVLADGQNTDGGVW